MFYFFFPNGRVNSVFVYHLDRQVVNHEDLIISFLNGATNIESDAEITGFKTLSSANGQFFIDHNSYELHPNYQINEFGFLFENLEFNKNSLYSDRLSIFDKMLANILFLDLNSINQENLVGPQIEAFNMLININENFSRHYFAGKKMFKKKIRVKMEAVWPFAVTDNDIVSFIKELIIECKQNLNIPFNWEMEDLINRAKFCGLMRVIMDSIEVSKCKFFKFDKHRDKLEIMDSFRPSNFLDIWIVKEKKEVYKVLDDFIKRSEEIFFQKKEDQYYYIVKSKNKLNIKLAGLIIAFYKAGWINLNSIEHDAPNLVFILNSFFHLEIKDKTPFTNAKLANMRDDNHVDYIKYVKPLLPFIMFNNRA